MSDTTEPAPLTEREMNQFITLAALPTLERALERLRWLEAQRNRPMDDNTLKRENQFYAEIATLRAELAVANASLAQRTADLAKATAERDEAVNIERERCLRIVRSVNNYSNPMTADDCAHLIAQGMKVAVTELGSNADELARLRAELVQRTAEVAKATAERDEARRDLCMSEAIDRLHEAHPNAPISRCASIRIANEIAVEYGWDCFDAKEVQR